MQYASFLFGFYVNTVDARETLRVKKHPGRRHLDIYNQLQPDTITYMKNGGKHCKINASRHFLKVRHRGLEPRTT